MVIFFSCMQMRVAVNEVYKYRRWCEKVMSCHPTVPFTALTKHTTKKTRNNNDSTRTRAHTEHHGEVLAGRTPCCSNSDSGTTPCCSNSDSGTTPSRSYSDSGTTPSRSYSDSDGFYANEVQPILWHDQCVWTPGM